MSDMWIEASRDAESERALARLTAARIAAAPVWPFLASATSEVDFGNRKALAFDRLESAVASVAGGPDFALLHALEASFDHDFATLHRARIATEIERTRSSIPTQLKEAGHTVESRTTDDGRIVYVVDGEEMDLRTAADRFLGGWDTAFGKGGSKRGRGGVPVEGKHDDDAQQAICSGCGKQIVRYDDGVWFGAAMGGTYDCPSGGLHQPDSSKSAARTASESPDWLKERVNDPYGTSTKHEFWSTVDATDINGYSVFERDGRWYAYHRTKNYWMKLSATDAASARAEVEAMDAGLDMWAARRDSRIVASEGGQTCAECGAAIERDPAGEEPRTWHHADGNKHEHEAKPASETKESAKTAGRYCKTHQVWIGEGNASNHDDDCKIEEKATEASRAGGAVPFVAEGGVKRADLDPDDLPYEDTHAWVDERSDASGPRIDTLRQIVKNHAWDKIDGMVVDPTTANLLIQVYEALSPANQAKFDTVPLEKLVDIGWKHTGSNNPSSGSNSPSEGNPRHLPLLAVASHRGGRGLDVREGAPVPTPQAPGPRQPLAVASWMPDPVARWGEGFRSGRQAAAAGASVGEAEAHHLDALARANYVGDVDSAAQHHGFVAGMQAHHRVGEFRKGAPFAGYEDFDACVRANSDKDDPEAYCGKIKHQVEDKKTGARQGDVCEVCGKTLTAPEIERLNQDTDFIEHDGHLIRVRKVSTLAAGIDNFGDSKAKPFGEDEDDDEEDKKRATLHTADDATYQAAYTEGEGVVTVVRNVPAGVTGPFGDFPAASLADAERVLQENGYAVVGEWERSSLGDDWAPLVRIASKTAGDVADTMITPWGPQPGPDWQGYCKTHEVWLDNTNSHLHGVNEAGDLVCDIELRKRFEASMWDTNTPKDEGVCTCGHPAHKHFTGNEGNPPLCEGASNCACTGYSPASRASASKTATQYAHVPPHELLPGDHIVGTDFVVASVEPTINEPNAMGDHVMWQVSMVDGRHIAYPSSSSVPIIRSASKTAAKPPPRVAGERAYVTAPSNSGIRKEVAPGTVATAGQGYQTWVGTIVYDWHVEGLEGGWNLGGTWTEQTTASVRTAGAPPWLNKGDGESKPEGDKPAADKPEGSEFTPGQKVTISYTLASGVSGTLPGTFESEQNGQLFFDCETGRFGVTKQGSDYVDSQGTKFTFEPAEEEAAPAAEQPTPPAPPVQSSRRVQAGGKIDPEWARAHPPLCARGCGFTLSAADNMVNTERGLAHRRCPPDRMQTRANPYVPGQAGNPYATSGPGTTNNAPTQPDRALDQGATQQEAPVVTTPMTTRPRQQPGVGEEMANNGVGGPPELASNDPAIPGSGAQAPGARQGLT